MTTQPRPTDSMKSTWRKNKSSWMTIHHVINAFDPVPTGPEHDPPVFQKDDPVPVMTLWSANLFITMHALWPLAIQYAYYAIFQRNMHPVGAFFLYSAAMQLNGMHQVKVLRRLAKVHGYFDGDKHARDDVPDWGLWKVLASVQLTTMIRPIFTIFIAYKTNEVPYLTWWLPLELFLYSIVLDFWFYTYHRACHEIDSLWQYHRTHHLTKHPSPLLSSWADAEQEVIEIALVPLATFIALRLMGLPMGFGDWWICHSFVLYSEAFGHSGLRVHVITAGLSSYVLEPLGCELAVEDHDLHHRIGWKSSHNYGKQTRLFDRLFGTTAPRVENNIDYKNKINMPLF